MTRVKFACAESAEALIYEKLEKLTVTPPTVSGLVSAMQKWIDNNEPKKRRFYMKEISKGLHRLLSVKKNCT